MNTLEQKLEEEYFAEFEFTNEELLTMGYKQSDIEFLKRCSTSKTES